MIGLVILWMIYRLGIFFAEKCFNKTYTYQLEVEPKSKKYYGQVK